MQRSGCLWGIVQQHGVALHGLLGISELTPCAQKRREAGRPVRADMHGALSIATSRAGVQSVQR